MKPLTVTFVSPGRTVFPHSDWGEAATVPRVGEAVALQVLVDGTVEERELMVFAVTWTGPHAVRVRVGG